MGMYTMGMYTMGMYHRTSIQPVGKRGGGRLFFTRIEPNWGMLGRRRGGPGQLFLYMRAYNAESPKQDRSWYSLSMIELMHSLVPSRRTDHYTIKLHTISRFWQEGFSPTSWKAGTIPRLNLGNIPAIAGKTKLAQIPAIDGKKPCYSYFMYSRDLSWEYIYSW